MIKKIFYFNYCYGFSIAPLTKLMVKQIYKNKKTLTSYIYIYI